MIQNYFVHNGQRYYTGTEIIVKQSEKFITGRMVDTKAIFMYFNTDTENFVFKINNCEHLYPKKMFDKVFVGVGDNVVDCETYKSNIAASNITIQQKHKFSDELRIDGMFLAWIWYVFIMAIAVIFRDRIGIWILASIIFFTYRNKKIKEEGL